MFGLRETQTDLHPDITPVRCVVHMCAGTENHAGETSGGRVVRREGLNVYVAMEGGRARGRHITDRQSRFNLVGERRKESSSTFFMAEC